MSTHVFDPLPHHQDNGVAITDLFRDGGPGTTILLRQQALYVLTSSIDFVHSNNTLATQGFPTFETGLQAILETRGDKEAGAINMFNKNSCSLKRIHIRGCRGWGRTKPESKQQEEELRKQGKLGWIEGGGAMVWMGGPDSHDSIVEGCRLEDPRGWTSVHVCDFAVRTRVINNIVGPCGQQFPGGPWADGLSIAGRDSLIAGNTVIDATDGAIVVFCAPGSTITDNTIISKTRNLLGAINMVDDFPFAQDFSNTRVTGNVLRSEGDAFIRLGIGCGPTCWSPWQPGHTMNYGGHVLDNYIGPGMFGYGIALSGVKEFTVTGNVVLPSTEFVGNLDNVLWNGPPMPFLRQWSDRNRVQNCTIQPDFVQGEASYLIGVEPGFGNKVVFNGGQQLHLDVHGQTISGRGGIKLKQARWELNQNGELVLRRINGDVMKEPLGSGQILWKTRAGGHVDNPVLTFDEQGGLSIRTNNGTGQIIWDATSYLKPYLDKMMSLPPVIQPKQNDDGPKFQGHASVIFSNKRPFMEVKSKDDDIMYSTSYEYGPNDNWSLHSGHWIAIAPQSLRGFEPTGGAQEFETPRGRDMTAMAPPLEPQQHHSSSGAMFDQQQQERGFDNNNAVRGGFGSFVRDLGSSLQRNFDPNHPRSSFMSSLNHRNDNINMYPGQCPAPPIPPHETRPHDNFNNNNAMTTTTNTKVEPTFLFLDPKTGQIILHSSSSPTHPEDSKIHFKIPKEPIQEIFESAWLSMQIDSNLVLYVKKLNGELFVPWASHTGGYQNGLKLILNGQDLNLNQKASLELIDDQDKVIWSSISS
ncbi:hypothetical protein OIO90_003544 [Microbotryomycetes sp. JL221]|nr:hypothetical protein OIO90_003544 [Microbotryomycetes sp. JL221]